MAISTSYTKTPQAGDDSYSFNEDDLLLNSSIYSSGTNTLTLDVMANDLGGKAKTLFSVSDTAGNVIDPASLLNADGLINGASAWERTDQGNQIRINNGKIEYKINNLGENGLNSLAQDQVLSDTFTYAIRLGNGTLSWATVSINIEGANDGPVAVADTATGHENEVLSIDVLNNDTDADNGHVFSLVSVTQPDAGKGTVAIVDGKLKFNPGTDFDHLAQGASETVTVDYTMSDEFGAESSSSVTLTITGTNDAPTVAAALTSAADEGAAAYTVNLLTGAGDLDDGAVLSVTNVSELPAGVTVSGNTLSVDPTNAAFNHLASGVQQPITVTYNVTDEHGASVAQSVTITITGTNDKATITGVSSGSVTEATTSSTGTPTASGDLLSSDVDNTTDVFQAVTTAALSVSGYGHYTISSTGLWDYTLDNANAAVEALATGQTLNDSFVVYSEDGTAKTVSIMINGASDIVNHAPTDISLVMDAAGTGMPGAGQIGTLFTTDADAGDTFSYSLLAGTSSGFSISGNVLSTAGLTGNTTYTLNIETKDSANETFAETFHIITGTGAANNLTPASGDLGDDVLYGLNNNDIILAGSGNDTLFGQSGDDKLVGGSDSDTLWGGAGADTFVWSLADANTASIPVDTIMDWGTGGTADKLDLKDLLQGEHANATTLDNFLDFSFSSTTGDTTISVRSGGAGADVDQRIVLDNIDLTVASSLSDQAIITSLLNQGKLIVTA